MWIIILLILIFSCFYFLKHQKKSYDKKMEEYIEYIEDTEKEGHVCTPGKIECTCPESCIIHGKKRLRCAICGRFLSKKKFLEDYNA